jgi:hypothetical protein
MTHSAWRFGNAETDGQHHRGWIVGHFIEGDDLRSTTDVEIKWGAHAAGEQRDAWQGDDRPPARQRTLPHRPVGGILRSRSARRLRHVGPRHRTLVAGRGGVGRHHRAVAVGGVELPPTGTSVAGLTCGSRWRRPQPPGMNVQPVGQLPFGQPTCHQGPSR